MSHGTAAVCGTLPLGSGNQRDRCGDQESVHSAVRPLLAVATTAALVLIGTAPAAAHVEATVDPGAQAGAGPVAVAFSAEAESPSAGIASIRAQLPAGIPPESVSLASGPAGWVLSPTADGYDITGPPLAPGTDAEFGITIAQLPADATVLVFKTLVRYTDGQEDAWIEEPTADNPEPENPAPVITVAPAAAPTTSTPSSSAAASTTSAAATTPSTTPEARADDEDGASAWPWVLGAGLVVAVVGGLAYRWFGARSRRDSS